jgi:hypothetical protein
MMKVLLAGVFVLAFTSLVVGQIPAFTAGNPMLSFSPANSCTKAVICFGHLLKLRLSYFTANGGGSGLNVANINADATKYDPSTGNNYHMKNLKGDEIDVQVTKYCDYPSPYTTISGCLDDDTISNSKCLQNFLAQVDDCTNAFLALPPP